MSLSAHFLKYATVATYLQPKLSEVEIVEAIRFHYPIHIQRMLLTVQSKSISETLHLLKRIEAMEIQESYHKPMNTKTLSSPDNSNIRLNQRRVQKTNTPKDNYEQRSTRRNYQLPENDTYHTNTRPDRDNEYTSRRNPQSEN
jgi:hypothetical protein